MSTQTFRGTRPKWRVLLSFASLLVLGVATIPVAPAQGQGSGGSGGGKPGGGETTTGNNLAYPTNFYKTSLQTGVLGSYDLGALFGSGMSYGCAIPETIGTTTYPNTSCVTTTGTPQDSATCQAKCGVVPVERIYAQKNAYNRWQAGWYATSTSALPVAYIDWGDNLESKSWPVGTIRVETNTFSTVPEAGLTNPRARFEVWHVFDQGTNELWGVHTSNADPAVPYVYVDAGAVNWPYGVNVSSTARLNVAKLAIGGATCPSVATGLDQSPYQGLSNLTWNAATGSWGGVPYFTDALYGAELSIKGSYVYGYNWSLNNEPVPPDVGKTGWWRLTFYTPDKSIDFTNFVDATSLNNTLAPPASTTSLPSLLPIAAPILLVPQAPVPLEATAASLYVAQVDRTNQLTYIDLCILEGKGGGGGKGRTK